MPSDAPVRSARASAQARLRRRHSRLYVRTELHKLGLTDIRTDEMLNVSGVRKGTGQGPSVAFAAHLDTVFPAGTDLTVRRDGNRLRAPGIGDDTGNVVAMLEAFRALNRAGIQTKGDLIFVATTQEEVGLKGAEYWLTHAQQRPSPCLLPRQTWAPRVCRSSTSACCAAAPSRSVLAYPRLGREP